MYNANEAREAVKKFNEKKAAQHQRDIEDYCNLFGTHIRVAAEKGETSYAQRISSLPNGITGEEFYAAMSGAGYKIETYGFTDKVYVCWGE